MLIKLALQNIREKKLRTFFAGLSISIGTASLILFMGLSAGVQNATFEEIEKNNPLTQIEVRAKNDNNGVVSFLTKSLNRLTKNSYTEIAAIDGVKKINPEIQFDNFASVEANLLGFSLITDSAIFGVPKDYITNDLNIPSTWDKTIEPYPAIVPRKVLDLYNFTIAAPQGLPTLSEDKLLGKQLTLYPNYSTFFPGLNSKDEIIDLEIVGFSDKVNLIGVTLPDTIVADLNQKFGKAQSPENESYLTLYIETENSSITGEVAKKIEDLGYNTQYYQKNIQEVEGRFKYMSLALIIISGIILLTSTIAIISTFLATIAERTNEIGLFRALGATKRQIKTIILSEATIIGFMGSAAGTIVGIIISHGIDQAGLKFLADTSFTPDTLFKISPLLILNTILFGTALTILAAYIPATKGANINPIDALNK